MKGIAIRHESDEIRLTFQDKVGRFAVSADTGE